MKAKERTITPLPHPPLKKLRDVWSSRSPLLLFAIKSALAAGFSWAIVSSLLGEEAAALAVVSAVIVVQVTSWQTARKSIERILGVIIGVILAVLIAHLFGLNFWTITLMIFSAQIIGMFLQNRGQYLATQIPISAALALLLGATAGNYPLLRMLGALVGGLIGTVISLLLSPPIYIFRARDAVAELMTRLAAAIPRLAAALAVQLNEAESREIYTHIRNLEQQVGATEQAYSLGLDSARLNPWARRARRLLVDYPDVLLALDRLVRQMRRIAYTINEPEPSWSEIVQKQDWALDYARLLEEIGSILVSAAVYVRSPATTQSSD
ncbi:MAG TPA: FUSC family protein, partial [Ktedonobacteraceae bacterium]